MTEPVHFPASRRVEPAEAEPTAHELAVALSGLLSWGSIFGLIASTGISQSINNDRCWTKARAVLARYEASQHVTEARS